MGNPIPPFNLGGKVDESKKDIGQAIQFATHNGVQVIGAVGALVAFLRGFFSALRKPK